MTRWMNTCTGPMDEYVHGTAVAGVIAAIPDNGIGISGVNWRCRILPAKAAWGGFIWTHPLANAIDYATGMGAHVINLSLGGALTTPELKAAIEYAYESHVAMFVASGNSATESTMLYPQYDPRVILVNASTELDEPTVFTCFSVRSDIAAPGGGTWGQLPESEDPREGVRNILTLRAAMAGSGPWHDVPSPDENDPGEYVRMAGTSFAAPAAAGVAALRLAKGPILSPERLRQLLRKSADDISSPGWDLETGYGRVDAAQALYAQPSCIGVARITDPRNWYNVGLLQSGNLEIRGLALAPWFLQYRLEYGPGSRPADGEWSLILTRTQQVGSEGPPVQEGQLGIWNVSSLAPGDYSLRLKVISVYGVFEDRLEVKKGPNLQAGQWPLVKTDSYLCRRDSVLADRGASGSWLVRTDYLSGNSTRLEVTTSAGSLVWSNVVTGLILGAPAVGEIVGTNPGLEVVIATGNTSSGNMTVRLYKISDGVEITNGWPKNLGSVLFSSGYAYDAVVFANDIDPPAPGEEPEEEVFVARTYYYNRTKIYGYRGEGGSALPGWTGKQLWWSVQTMPTPLVIADLAAGEDNDGKEVAILQRVWNEATRSCELKLHVWNRLGVLLQGAPFSLGTFELAANEWPARVGLVASDFDNDLDENEDNELVVVFRIHGIVRKAFVGICEGSTGVRLSPEWFTVELGGEVIGEATYTPGDDPFDFIGLGDMDGDLSLDIVFDMPGVIEVLNAWGEPLPTLTGEWIGLAAVEAPLTIGDVSGDGSPEIITGPFTGEGVSIYAFRSDGSVVPGWPLLLEGTWLQDAMPIARADSDGDNELFVETDPTSSPTRVYCFDTPGVGVVPWPMARRTSGNTAAIEVLRGDADDDGAIECEDGDYIMDYLFLNGPPPIQLKSADYNHDNYVDISDALAIYSDCQ